MLSLAVLDLMVARLEGAATLRAWAQSHGQPLPVVGIGQQVPGTADAWPYVLLAPSVERRDLVQGTLDQLSVVAACGVRLDESSADQVGRGTRLLADLAEVVLGLLADPHTYTVGPSDLLADYAELADTGLAHPSYEVQVGIALRLLSDAHD